MNTRPAIYLYACMPCDCEWTVTYRRPNPMPMDPPEDFGIPERTPRKGKRMTETPAPPAPDPAPQPDPTTPPPSPTQPQ